ncbi:hypothetical protein TELCIR_22392, partial [Teladorsagia circumcincta]
MSSRLLPRSNHSCLLTQQLFVARPYLLALDSYPNSGAKNGEHFEWALLRGGNIVRKLGNEATLHVKGADPSNDYGVYRCNVEDDNGVVIGSAYTAVSVGYSGQS